MPIGYEAKCTACGETFCPNHERDLVHLERADGSPCGGLGELKGAWDGPPSLVFHSFADFKKKIRVGMRFLVENLNRPQASGERTISRVQTNALAAWVASPSGERVETWCYYPKSALVRIEVSHAGSRITFLNPDGSPAFTYYSFQEG